MTSLTQIEREIVGLLDEGWSRWKIAEKLGMGESTVRRVIKRLCDEYQCTQKELPEKLRKENHG